MRRQIKQLVVAAALISGLPALAVAQFPGAGNPWQGRMGLPPGTGPFDPFSQMQPNIPGLPPGVLSQMQPNIPGLPPGVGTVIHGPGTAKTWRKNSNSGMPPGSSVFDQFGKQQPRIPGLPPGVGTIVHGPGGLSPGPGELDVFGQEKPKFPSLPPGSGSFTPVALPQISPDLIRPSTIVMPKLEPGLLRSGATTHSEPFRWPTSGVMTAFVVMAVICFLTAIGAGYNSARAR